MNASIIWGGLSFENPAVCIYGPLILVVNLLLKLKNSNFKVTVLKHLKGVYL